MSQRRRALLKSLRVVVARSFGSWLDEGDLRLVARVGDRPFESTATFPGRRAIELRRSEVPQLSPASGMGPP